MERLYIEYQGDSIELPRGETVVGRDVGCALRFNDPSVSRRHLRFIRRADEAFVEDLGSSNGTLLNGRAVSRPVRVKDGDVLQIGNRTISVHAVPEDYDAPKTLIIGESDDPTIDDAATAAPPRGISTRVTMPMRVPGAVTAPPPVRAATESAPIDRRRHDRVAMELRLIYVSDELEIEATTLDLSHSGVFVCTQILDPIGTRCRLTLLVDGGPPLQLDGVVRRVVAHSDREVVAKPVGLGVELVGLGPAERAWIDHAMKQMAPE